MTGMALSNLIMYFIIMTTATTLARAWHYGYRDGEAGGGSAATAGWARPPTGCSRWV